MLFCRAVGSMGQRKSGAPGAAAPISTEEEQLKFQDSRFLATLVLGRSRWVTERDWLTACLYLHLPTDVSLTTSLRQKSWGTWSVRDPYWNPGIRLRTDYCCEIECESRLRSITTGNNWKKWPSVRFRDFFLGRIFLAKSTEEWVNACFYICKH